METMNTETASASPALVTIQSIASAKTPTSFEKIRSLTQKERSAKIRNMLRAAGVKGVSVTSATGSMCYWTHVRFAQLEHPAGTNWDHNRLECSTCRVNQQAVRTLESLILAAFPDMGDRSDSMVDHFDFVFTVGAK